MMDMEYEFELLLYVKINANKYMINKQWMNNRIMDEWLILQGKLDIQLLGIRLLDYRLMMIVNREALKNIN